MKKIFSYLLAAGTALTFSCKDFLEEKMVSTVAYDYYNTEKGMEDLVNGVYSEMRFLFNGEVSFSLTNYGVDEYTQAADGQHKYFDSYTTQLNPLDAAYLHDMWQAYYRGINGANIGIEKLPSVTYQNEATKKSRVAELRFLRAFYYFQLVQQFGGVPLSLEGEVAVRLEFPRATAAQVYQAIIRDLRAAEADLVASNRKDGRITKGAAQHYLAKVYLTRGSAVTDQRGQKPTDMDSAAYYADQVIASPTYQLVQNYADLWRIDNQENSEVILAAQFNTNLLLLNGSGNRTHLYYLMVYDILPGMLRDIPNGRPWRRLMPTDYAIDIFDRKNDSRFYKSFKMTYFSNNANTIPKWTAANAPTPDLVGKPKFAVGDTAVYLTLQRETDQSKIDKKPYLWIPRNKFTKQEFPSLVKHMDPLRADVGTEFGTRDGVYARLGETYLIAAEAYGRKGNYAKALEYINALRRRAAYKAGERKPQEHWLVEGGQKNDLTSTEAPLLATEADFMVNDPAELYPPSASTPQERFLHFILNERTRELLGEFHRWEDLARTETLFQRVSLFNPAATGIQPHHRLRPIPQQHLERVYEGGQPLTIDQQKAIQNPGY